MKIFEDQLKIFSNELKIYFNLINNSDNNIIVKQEIDIKFKKVEKELYKLIKLNKYINNLDIVTHQSFFFYEILNLDQYEIDNIISIEQIFNYHKELKIKIKYKFECLIKYINSFINFINSFLKYKIKYDYFFELLNDIELLRDLLESI